MFWSEFVKSGSAYLSIVVCRSVCLTLLVCVTACSQLSNKEVAPPSAAEAAKQQEQARLTQDFAAALVKHRNGEIDAAKEAYTDILGRQPTLINPRFNLAQIALDEGRLEDASAALDEVIKQRPDHKQALNLKGVMAREAGKFKEAEAFYRQSLAVDPSYLSAVRNLAILLDIYMGRLDEALSLYEQYQSLLDEPDAQVKDWIFDLKRRLGGA